MEKKTLKSYFIFIVFMTVALIFSTNFLAQSAEIKPIYPDPEKWVTPTPKKKYVIGACVPMMGAPFWNGLSYGIFSQAKKLDVKLLFFDAGGYQYLEKQIKQVEDLIAQKVDAIVICPASSKGTVEVLERAISKGIIVVNTISRTYSDKIHAAVLDDDIKLGEIQAEYIDKKFNGKAKGVMLCGPAGSDWSMNRVKGFKEYIADKPGIRVVAEKWSEPNIEVAQAIVDDYFQAFPDMQFIYTAADGMAVGAANAARGVNKLDQVVITTASFSPEGARYLKRGWIDLDIGESPVLEGAWAMDVAVMALNGQEYPKLIYVPNPPFTKKSFEDPEDKKYFKYQWAEEGWKVPTF